MLLFVGVTSEGRIDTFVEMGTSPAPRAVVLGM